MSLVKIAKEARLSLKIGAGLVFLIFLIFIVFQGGTLVQKTFFPKPPPLPEEKFGILPKIIFPNSSNTTLPEFRINTISGELPSFPSQILVYKLVESIPGITSLRNARDRAFTLGYTENQQAISTSEYKWTKTNQNNVLKYNIGNFNFSVNSDYLVNPIYLIGRAPDKENLFKTVSEFIDTLGASRADINFDNAQITYYTISNGQLSEIDNSFSSQIARIDLYQNPVDNLPIYYPLENGSVLYFMLSTVEDNTQIVEASYNHASPNTNESSTYPSKTSQEAYEDLKNGNGFILTKKPESLVDITDVTEGYFLGDDVSQEYLLPIIIFTGKNNFKAYVSAIRD